MKLKELFNESAEPLTVTIDVLRDGGSNRCTFSDGFICLFDWGVGSKTRGKFVKSWEDRTVIELPKKYLDIAMNNSDWIKSHYKG